ncbi:hypothetical protein BpHYR1_011530 [Brachionus plicatilis]|uniref:Uncharacterized protein n=1 Tax=Brachionus plicatilis TaxID=10195 RepID=A0A3M7QZR7_BRAPC|nr:hypothetical protein BpHYR1_011530 [Brachionus plicatilis]
MYFLLLVVKYKAQLLVFSSIANSVMFLYFEVLGPKNLNILKILEHICQKITTKWICSAKDTFSLITSEGHFAELTSNDHFAGDKNQQHHFGLVQPVNQAGKQLGLVAAELRVTSVKALEAQTKAHVNAAHNVLNFEVHELGRKAQLLNDARILSGRQSRVLLALGSGAHHFARAEN